MSLCACACAHARAQRVYMLRGWPLWQYLRMPYHAWLSASASSVAASARYDRQPPSVATRNCHATTGDYQVGGQCSRHDQRAVYRLASRVEYRLALAQAKFACTRHPSTRATSSASRRGRWCCTAVVSNAFIWCVVGVFLGALGKG